MALNDSNKVMCLAPVDRPIIYSHTRVMTMLLHSPVPSQVQTFADMYKNI